MDKNELIDEEKIEKIISELTLKEKVAMCHGNGLFRTEGVKRLNIPPIKMSDGPMGVRAEFPDDSWMPIGNSDDYVTYLPCNTALASTWNVNLAHEAGRVLGNEARGRGKDIILGPGINIVRSPLCGRNFEYMSEDPYLISKLAVPFIKGVQENNDVAACVKHFAVNNQETERLKIEVEVDERTLKELYLPAFEAAVKEGNTYSIMTAYNKLFGYYCSHNEYLIKEILEDEWGFDGVVVSDWGAIHDTVEAAIAGMDIEMNVTYNFDEYFFAKPLIKAVEEGKISEEVINDKIRRILRLMYKINIFSDDRKSGRYNLPKHREKTLDIARESIVLLKNENNVLPLKDSKIKTLAVIGENANTMHSNGGGSAEIKALYEVTPLLGIKTRLGGQTEVKYAKGYSADKSEKEKLIEEAVELAKISDAVVIIGGLKHTAEDMELENNALTVSKDKEIKRYVDSEGYDKTDMDLPYNQDELINRVLEVNKNAVVVMLSGAPVKMTEWIDNAATVVQTWYNGMEGGTALAEILFGDVNPSGKLPVTFPRELEDSPAHKIGEFPGGEKVKYTEGIFVGYRYFSTYDVKPLFCFGHGLSYTNFKYEDLKISVNEEVADVDISAVFKLTNTGHIDGAETVQVYVKDAEASVERPKIELKGFDKVYLKAGEIKEIEIKLDKKALAFYSVEDKKWTVERGTFEIFVGSSSEDIRLNGEINLESSYKFK
ncbi:beta-glucosidase [Clostridium saccharoperbutylacetonicum]|uniref:Thermostable beta-glucosidase B n=1 Tax=Clostridium saccharoperbutylacetonicum N1-4(HMT) TaxID=931276 RepID=M1MCD1_9CLOT|nr:glycoside hydrolase family 3 C-terminal domain-containing protein [Clostridium saccharoperbutylacetonicum]AGF54088.1 thermostable beta-glucosidase B [Clostridium saccharoperbutylacetonicum N1-4(HMT)]NRT59399.1 beta-glucosidase [Clostridium saccharoperbutylacetonicum]NSB28590.1 beta-glucosidase [Clostridium saccharoperbutylacetonicum]NSB42082.1 beta-glucosidase [Clostridium saccharoperbutylacetonicum]